MTRLRSHSPAVAALILTPLLTAVQATGQTPDSAPQWFRTGDRALVVTFPGGTTPAADELEIRIDSISGEGEPGTGHDVLVSYGMINHFEEDAWQETPRGMHSAQGTEATCYLLPGFPAEGPLDIDTAYLGQDGELKHHHVSFASPDDVPLITGGLTITPSDPDYKLGDPAWIDAGRGLAFVRVPASSELPEEGIRLLAADGTGETGGYHGWANLLYEQGQAYTYAGDGYDWTWNLAGPAPMFRDDDGSILVAFGWPADRVRMRWIVEAVNPVEGVMDRWPATGPLTVDRNDLSSLPPDFRDNPLPAGGIIADSLTMEINRLLRETAWTVQPDPWTTTWKPFPDREPLPIVLELSTPVGSDLVRITGGIRSDGPNRIRWSGSTNGIQWECLLSGETTKRADLHILLYSPDPVTYSLRVFTGEPGEDLPAWETDREPEADLPFVTASSGDRRLCMIHNPSEPRRMFRFQDDRQSVAGFQWTGLLHPGTLKFPGQAGFHIRLIGADEQTTEDPDVWAAQQLHASFPESFKPSRPPGQPSVSVAPFADTWPLVFELPDDPQTIAHVLDVCSRLTNTPDGKTAARLRSTAFRDSYGLPVLQVDRENRVVTFPVHPDPERLMNDQGLIPADQVTDWYPGGAGTCRVTGIPSPRPAAGSAAYLSRSDVPWLSSDDSGHPYIPGDWTVIDWVRGFRKRAGDAMPYLAGVLPSDYGWYMPSPFDAVEIITHYSREADGTLSLPSYRTLRRHRILAGSKPVTLLPDPAIHIGDGPAAVAFRALGLFHGYYTFTTGSSPEADRDASYRRQLTTLLSSTELRTANAAPNEPGDAPSIHHYISGETEFRLRLHRSDSALKFASPITPDKGQVWIDFLTGRILTDEATEPLSIRIEPHGCSFIGVLPVRALRDRLYPLELHRNKHPAAAALARNLASLAREIREGIHLDVRYPDTLETDIASDLQVILRNRTGNDVVPVEIAIRGDAAAASIEPTDAAPAGGDFTWTLPLEATSTGLVTCMLDVTYRTATGSVTLTRSACLPARAAP